MQAFHSAIRRVLSSGQDTVARLTADPKAFNSGVSAVRKAIPVPLRWFIRTEQIERALKAAMTAAASANGAQLHAKANAASVIVAQVKSNSNAVDIAN